MKLAQGTSEGPRWPIWNNLPYVAKALLVCIMNMRRREHSSQASNVRASEEAIDNPSFFRVVEVLRFKWKGLSFDRGRLFSFDGQNHWDAPRVFVVKDSILMSGALSREVESV
jgi:hypothetical protein